MNRKHRQEKYRRARQHQVWAAGKDPETRGAVASVPPAATTGRGRRKVTRTSRPFEMRVLGRVKLERRSTRPSGNKRRRARALRR